TPAKGLPSSLDSLGPVHGTAAPEHQSMRAAAGRLGRPLLPLDRQRLADAAKPGREPSRALRYEVARDRFGKLALVPDHPDHDLVTAGRELDHLAHAALTQLDAEHRLLDSSSNAALKHGSAVHADDEGATLEGVFEVDREVRSRLRLLVQGRQV